MNYKLFLKIIIAPCFGTLFEKMKVISNLGQE
jgi:hypothetical protein